MRLVAGVLAGLGAVAASPGGDASVPAADVAALVVFAPADLARVVEPAARVFEQATGRPVHLVFGSAGLQALQLAQGAPADVVITDQPGTVEQLTVRGAVWRGSERALGPSRLVVAAAADGPKPVLTPAAGAGRIAVINPEAGAAGRETFRALRRLGHWPALASDLVYAEDARHALLLLRQGAVALAVVPEAALPGQGERWAPLPGAAPALHPVAALVRGSPRLTPGRRFIELLAASSSPR